MFKLKLQLHGGGGGSSIKTEDAVKNSAPGSTAAATIDNATEGDRQKIREKMATAKGREYTDKTNGAISEVVQTIKKQLLGE